MWPHYTDILKFKIQFKNILPSQLRYSSVFMFLCIFLLATPANLLPSLSSMLRSHSSMVINVNINKHILYIYVFITSYSLWMFITRHTNFVNIAVICIFSYIFYYSAFLVPLFCSGWFEVNGNMHLFANLMYITTIY